MTYEELIELCKQGDPLIDPNHPERASVTEKGLLS